jgi:MFS family permease
MLRAFIIFILTVFIGVIVCPFVIWAAAGFPGEGSHGLWMPVMFAFYLGLPGGIFFGIIFGLISLLFPSQMAQAEAQMREDMK